MISIGGITPDLDEVYNSLNYKPKTINEMCQDRVDQIQEMLDYYEEHNLYGMYDCEIGVWTRIQDNWKRLIEL
ncbi:hypothetical protein [Anaerovorax sp. IOR16]|uniref:hypothetical protein n=1 Tax=Anaerovorax sp. IOR16 TaxID=2773458 RepID=UPI0019D0895C|nr:hypothetical protein [Anaerovorax sp. IOR16]